jgi:hypothetical protein
MMIHPPPSPAIDRARPADQTPCGSGLVFQAVIARLSFFAIQESALRLLASLPNDVMRAHALNLPGIVTQALAEEQEVCGKIACRVRAFLISTHIRTDQGTLL